MKSWHARTLFAVSSEGLNEARDRCLTELFAALQSVQHALADPATTAVVACARAGNAGSLRVLEKLGLQRVGPTVKLARVKELRDPPGEQGASQASAPVDW